MGKLTESEILFLKKYAGLLTEEERSFNSNSTPTNISHVSKRGGEKDTVEFEIFGADGIFELDPITSYNNFSFLLFIPKVEVWDEGKFYHTVDVLGGYSNGKCEIRDARAINFSSTEMFPDENSLITTALKIGNYLLNTESVKRMIEKNYNDNIGSTDY